MTNLFFSYSHKDEALRNELDKHLTILKRQGIITAWHDRCIQPGSDFGKEINKNLKNADIILLLISADFLASDYCYDNEMKLAIERHEKGDAIVIPVILRPCDWKDTPFGKLLATPTDGKPVVKFATLDDAFLEVTSEIKKAATNTNKLKKSTGEILPTNEAEQKPLPRSSNLRIAKKFSNHEKDKYLDDSFEYIANYFEGSLIELKKRNPHIEHRFKKIDSQTITANIYMEGNTVAECMIFYGDSTFSANAINYSNRISQSKNSYNESLRLEDDGYILYFRPTGISMFGKSSTLRDSKMTNEGAAEYLWELFIEPLQRD